MTQHIVVVAAVLLHIVDSPPDYPYTGPCLHVHLLENAKNGYLVLAGGKLESTGFPHASETPDEAIKRELREELGYAPAVRQLSFGRTTYAPHDAVMLYYSGLLTLSDVGKLRNAEPGKHTQLVSVGVHELPLDKMWAHDVAAIRDAVAQLFPQAQRMRYS